MTLAVVDRFMLDALNPHNLPRDIPLTTLLASYVDYIGASPQPFTVLKALFPTHRLVSISTQGAPAQIGDFERGAMLPPVAPQWITRARAAGYTPWAYATESTWGQIQHYCAVWNVALPLWLKADWADGPNIPDGAIGVQYASTNLYDSSVLLPYIKGFDPDPTDTGDSAGDQEEDDMATSVLPTVLVSAEDGGAEVLLRWPDGSYEICRAGATAHAFTAAGAPTISIPLVDIQTRQAQAKL